MKINASHQITQLKHLNMFQIEYLDRLGNQRQWTIASRQPLPKCETNQFDKPEAVVIAALHVTRKKLVIIKEFRVALGDYQFGFPAGLVDKKESLEAASRRELEEETGLKIVRIHKISPPIYSSSGVTDESISMVFCEVDGEPCSKGNEASEEIETLFVSPEEAEAICNDHKIKTDVKTWLVLSGFARTGNLL